MSSGSSTRRAKKHADRVTASGQFTLPGAASAVPAKSTVSSSPLIRTVTPDRDVAVEDPVALDLAGGGVLAVGKPPDRVPGVALGVGHDLVEGGQDGVAAAAPHQLGQPPLGELVGGDLGAEVPAADPGRAGVGQNELEHV